MYKNSEFLKFPREIIILALVLERFENLSKILPLVIHFIQFKEYEELFNILSSPVSDIEKNLESCSFFTEIRALREKFSEMENMTVKNDLIDWIANVFFVMGFPLVKEGECFFQYPFHKKQDIFFEFKNSLSSSTRKPPLQGRPGAGSEEMILHMLQNEFNSEEDMWRTVDLLSSKENVKIVIMHEIKYRLILPLLAKLISSRLFLKPLLGDQLFRNAIYNGPYTNEYIEPRQFITQRPKQVLSLDEKLVFKSGSNIRDYLSSDAQIFKGFHDLFPSPEQKNFRLRPSDARLILFTLPPLNPKNERGWADQYVRDNLFNFLDGYTTFGLKKPGELTSFQTFGDSRIRSRFLSILSCLFPPYIHFSATKLISNLYSLFLAREQENNYMDFEGPTVHGDSTPLSEGKIPYTIVAFACNKLYEEQDLGKELWFLRNSPSDSPLGSQRYVRVKPRPNLYALFLPNNIFHGTSAWNMNHPVVSRALREPIMRPSVEEIWSSREPDPAIVRQILDENPWRTTLTMSGALSSTIIPLHLLIPFIVQKFGGSVIDLNA